ncbi:O-antigen ligase family protein [Bdellovibrio sp. BCCA]|uniref:O-antigen ligase family protein n=1 Tax=unclassified Bdellovibrio TaxID=2633795 RepID=UPI0030F36BFE
MITARDGRILFLIKALVALLFISKISLGSLLPVPQSFSYFIFQQGLHPFVNVFLCGLFGVPLVLLWLRVRDRNHLSGFYKLFLFFLILTLTVQTLLQAHYVNQEESAILQIGALAVAVFMIAVYGVIIPSLWDAEDFLKYVQRWSGVLVLISLALWVVAGGSVYKGGRFVGVFKHIPHMVTCATVAYVFSLGTFLQEEKLQHKIWSALILCASFFAIILTGTRSSAAAALMAFVVTMILHKTATNQGRIFKFAFLAFVITFTLFFGMQTYEFAHGIATGQSSLGGREAQDGVASRWEEVERGSQIFLEEPWLGHGLLSKFAAGNDVDVSNYNAMKDPHNIFVSAGVIGGWPLLVLSAVALILMSVGAVKALTSFDISKRQIAIYLLAHIPILVIYHVHLSIGGMADRLYWMVFGFVAASVSRTGKS